MIIRLLNRGVSVLTARTEHHQGNAARELPVSYEGDTSLLPPTIYIDDTFEVGELSTVFRRIADENGLEIMGDYVGMRRYGSVDFTGYPPETDEMRDGRE